MEPIFSIVTQYVQNAKQCAHICALCLWYPQKTSTRFLGSDGRGHKAICRSCAFWWNGIALLTSQILGHEMSPGSHGMPRETRNVPVEEVIAEANGKPLNFSSRDIIIQWHALFLSVLVLDLFSYSICKSDPFWQTFLVNWLETISANITF